MNNANKNLKYKSNNARNLKYKINLYFSVQSALNEYKSDCLLTEKAFNKIFSKIGMSLKIDNIITPLITFSCT